MNFDKYGHCVICHKNMTIEEVIDNRVQIRFTPEYTEEEFLLDNGSKMRVAMCRNCKDVHSEKDHSNIMQCVVNGWEEELKSNNWDDNKKKLYRDRYYGLNIITKSSGKADDVLEKEFKDFKDKRVK